MRTSWRHLKTHKKYIALTLGVLLLTLLFVSQRVSDTLHRAYESEISARVFDINGRQLRILPNPKGAYVIESTSTGRFGELAVLSEDRYFMHHPGVNPVSSVRALFLYLYYNSHKGGSTITQQLVKNLLHHENERTWKNKWSELSAALMLELHTPKQEILSMYLSSAYFGQQSEGIEQASLHYFGKDAVALTDGEILQLLALLQAPAFAPGSAGNLERAKAIGARIGVSSTPVYTLLPRSLKDTKTNPAMFELSSLVSCDGTCSLSVDGELTAKIREIVQGTLASPKFKSVGSAAVAVIRVGKGDEPNELLALVGSPDPYGGENGNQINMALASRPIGSTWKPFIYGKAIEKGARPYTIINDSEYRYEIGTGYAFYPKNYDGMYRGPVTLNYALSNSLNVPAVRALEFDGVDPFGVFMLKSLGFIPKQSMDTYQLSIALGGLEMNPLLLAEYFSVFSREGVLAPLSIRKGVLTQVPMLTPFAGTKRIFNATTTQLVNKMLSDRLMGVEQFGLESNLNLPFQGYAVKTGTTYDYHDSWTVGYTGDIVVVAWIGNSNNKAMDLLSGARGAGKIWHDTMSLLYARGELTLGGFEDASLVDVTTPEGNSFGLLGDDIEHARMVMQTHEDDVVLEPHDGDVLLFEKGMSVALRAKESLHWVIGSQSYNGDDVHWTPSAPGDYVITALSPKGYSVGTLHIHIVSQ